MDDEWEEEISKELSLQDDDMRHFKRISLINNIAKHTGLSSWVSDQAKLLVSGGGSQVWYCVCLLNLMYKRIEVC